MLLIRARFLWINSDGKGLLGNYESLPTGPTSDTACVDNSVRSHRNDDVAARSAHVGLSYVVLCVAERVVDESNFVVVYGSADGGGCHEIESI